MVVLFTALIAPFLISWSAYRTEIESEARRLIGHQVTINGEIDIRLLPSGVIRLGGVEIKSPEDPNNAAIASIELVKAKLALAPLLRGKFQFTDIEFVRPTFRFEISAGGIPNWKTAVERNFGGLIDPKNIILDDVLISNGAVFFTDAKRRIAHEVSPFNARISARALVGPYTATGDLEIAGQAREFSIRAGRASEASVRRFNLRLTVPEQENEQIVLDGFLDTSKDGPRFDGKINLSQDISYLEILKSIERSPKEEVRADLEAEIATSLEGIRLEDVNAVLKRGNSTARFSGRAQAVWQEGSDFIIELKTKRLDLDELLQLRTAKITPAQKQPVKRGKPDQNRLPSSLTPQLLRLMDKILPRLWAGGFDGRMSLNVDGVVLGGMAIEKSVLKLRFADNHIEVMEASGGLPGRSRLALKGLFLTTADVTSFDGTFVFNTANAEKFASWALPSMAPLVGLTESGFGGKLDAKGSLLISPKSIDMLNVGIQLDETMASAGLSYAIRKRPAFGLALSLDQIDLDRYFPLTENAGDKAEFANKATRFVKSFADLFGRFDANIRFNADKIISRGVTTAGLAADINLEAGRLNINKLDFADIGGASLRTKGTILNINRKPKGVLDASLVAANPTALFDLIGVTPGGRNGIRGKDWAKAFGPLSAGLSFEASVKDGVPRSFFRISGSAGGTKISSTLQILGKLSNFARSNLDFNAEAVNEDGDKLLAQVGWLSPDQHGSSAQTGVIRARIKGDVGQRLEIGFGVQAYGTRANLSGRLASKGGEPSLEADVTVESEDVRPLMAVVGSSFDRNTDVIPMVFHGLIAGKAPEFVLTGFSGTVGKVPVSLNGTMTFGGAVPRIQANVQAEEVSFPWVFSALFGGVDDTEKPKQPSGQIWSAQPFRLGILKAAEMSINLQADKVQTTTTTIDDVKAVFTSGREKFDLKRMSGKVYGGELSLNATLDETGNGLKLSSEYTLIDGDLEKIAKVKSKRGAIAGKAYISGRVQGEGRSLRGLISSMKGSGILKIQNGILRGINPATFAKALPSIETETELNGLIDGILAEGEMYYGDLDSSFTIDNGLVGTTDLRFKAEDVSGKASLVVDLTVFKLDNEWRFSFDKFPNSPPLVLLYTGLVNEPDRNFNAEALRGYLAVKALKDSVKRLEKIEEEELKRRNLEQPDVEPKPEDSLSADDTEVKPDETVRPEVPATVE